MAKKEILYAVGSVVCVVAIGAVVFHLAEANKTQNAAPVSSSLAQPPAAQQQQGVTGAAAADGSADVNADPASDAATTAAQPGAGGPRGNMPNIPAGDKPFFGQVATVNGDTVTVTSMGRRGGEANSNGTATSATTSAPQATTVTVTLADSTVFSGGTKDAIVAGARVFGYGTVSSDGSITAANIQINPTRPAGGNGGAWNHGGAATGTTQQ